MTVADAVVRWGVVVVVVAVSCVECKDFVDLHRCKDTCSSVPEDLWPSCCEAHNTCCQEFADSCMHDCLPRVHTGDVSVVEERPGMCCALYNLCCFRETFRISSSKSQQDPISFPIVHRFQVQQPSVAAARPQPRQQVLPAQDQDQGSFTPGRPSSSRPQSSKKAFRPSRPEGFKKLPSDEGENVEESKKPKSRPKFSGLLGNRNTPEERRKFNNEEPVNPSHLKVTTRPAGSDIRQEVHVAEAMNAEGIGARRLDASINPVVTRKRLLVASESRRAPRVEVETEEPQPEARGPRGRNLQSSPAREGRKINSGGRGANRPTPPPQQTSRRAQATATPAQDNSRAKTRPVVDIPAQDNSRAKTRPVVDIPAQDNSRAKTRPVVAIPAQDNSRAKTRPVIAIPTSPPLRPAPAKPVQDDTPEVTVTEKPSEAPMVKESESPAAEGEADAEIQSIIKALQNTQDISEPNAAPDTPQPSATEPSQPEEAMEKKVETPSEPAENTETEVETEAEPVKAAGKTAFTPPEIEVNTPKEPKVEEPKQERTSSSRSAGTVRDTEEAPRGRSNARQTGDRTTASARPTGDRTTARRTGQEAVRETTNTAQQTDRSRTISRSRGG